MRLRLPAPVTAWLALVLVLAAVGAASMRAGRPPRPLPADAAASRFSEGRARAIVRRLADDIGFRVNGTPAHAQAAEWLAGELSRIPGMEVEIQSVSGS